MKASATALSIIALLATASIIGLLLISYLSLEYRDIRTTSLLEDTISCNETNRVFSPGPVGFAISTGLRAPGENIGVYLYVHKPAEYVFNGTYVVRIYGLDNDRGSPILSKNISAQDLPANILWKIPSKNYHRKYVVIALAVENNSIVDCIRGIITIPEQEVKAKILLDKNVYRVGETVEFKIVNLGGTPISFGRPYQVYYLDNGKWVIADNLIPDTWTMELIVLEKNGSYAQRISLENAVPGQYKIVKIIHGEGTNITMRLETEFTVIGGS